MKKLIILSAFFFSLLFSSCNKDKEFCWDCTTDWNGTNKTMNTRCGLTKAEAEYYEKKNTETYKDVYGTTQVKTTQCKKQ